MSLSLFLSYVSRRPSRARKSSSPARASRSRRRRRRFPSTVLRRGGDRGARSAGCVRSASAHARRLGRRHRPARHPDPAPHPRRRGQSHLALRRRHPLQRSGRGQRGAVRAADQRPARRGSKWCAGRNRRCGAPKPWAAWSRSTAPIPSPAPASSPTPNMAASTAPASPAAMRCGPAMSESAAASAGKGATASTRSAPAATATASATWRPRCGSRRGRPGRSGSARSAIGWRANPNMTASIPSPSCAPTRWTRPGTGSAPCARSRGANGAPGRRAPRRAISTAPIATGSPARR